MNKKRILLLSTICVVVIILALIALDFSIIKYKEATWRDKIEIGMSEKEVYTIIPIKNGGCNLESGAHRTGTFELTDGTELSLSFHIPQEVIKKYIKKSAKKNDKVDTSNANFQYILESYKIKDNVILGNCKGEVKKSLEKLLLRTNSDSFVIFSNPKTNKYCQFANVKNGLFFDLPFLTLSKSEIKRAEVVLAKHGVPEAVYCCMYDSPGEDKKEVEGWKVFQKELGNDVDAATEIVIAVFKEVYQFGPDTVIKIKEN